MSLLKNKLFIVLLIAVTVCAWYEMWLLPTDKMQQDKLIAWLQTSNTRQFCSVIFPQVADCVTFQKSACENIVQQPLTGCIDHIKPGLGSEVTIPQSKEIYTKVATCFEKQLHQTILQNYLLDTAACRQKMS